MQVLWLQVGDSNMTNNAFLSQFHQCGKCLINHLLQVGKLHIVYVDKVDIIHMQPLHALIHAFRSTFGRVIPCVYAIFPVSSHLRRQIILVARDVFQCLPQYGFSLQMTIVRRYVDKVYAIFHGGKHGLNAFFFANAVQYAS